MFSSRPGKIQGIIHGIACWLPLVLLAEPGDRAFEQETARAWLGPDFAEAKFVAVHNGRITSIRLADGQAHARTPPEANPAFSRPVWSDDGSDILYSHLGRAYILRGPAPPQRLLPDQSDIHEPSFWTHPNHQARHIVYCDADTNANYHPNAPSPGNTWRVDLHSGQREHLFPFPCDGGLSRDGTRLGEAFGSALIVDLERNKARKLFDGQACNATISPDDSYRLMHLMLPHDRFVVRNEYGRELWKIHRPIGSSEWQTPRWSNHPDWCMATAKFGGDFVPVLVDMKQRRSLPLRSLGGGWWAPKLWLPSGMQTPADRSGPIDHLDLPAALVPYRKKFARAACYTPMLNELTRRQMEAANTIVYTIIHQGWQAFYAAAEMDPLQARATYRELAATYAGNRIGELAAQNLAGPQLARELAAWKQWIALDALHQSLVDLPGAARRFTEKTFFNRNQATLVRMVPLARELRFAWPGTAGAERAADLVESLQLPGVTSRPANRTLTFEGVITRTSTVPGAAEIAPYTAVLTWIEYDISRFLSRPVDQNRVMVVHWGMKNRTHTEATRWPVGTRQRIHCDLFSAHPELETISRAQDAYDQIELEEFFALSVTPLDAARGSAAAAVPQATISWAKGQGLGRSLVAGNAGLHPGNGSLILHSGSVELDQSEAAVTACRDAGTFTLEAHFRPDDIQGGRLLSVVDPGNRPNLALTQDGRWLALQLRTTNNKAPLPLPLAPVEPGKANHLRLQYRDGHLNITLNGKSREISSIRGGLSNWQAGHLILGDDLYGGENWNGQLDAFSLRPR